MPERRWPKVGDILTHRYRDGRSVKATVVEVDRSREVVAVTINGKRHESLSQAASALSGHPANGWLWWGLAPNQGTPGPARPDADPTLSTATPTSDVEVPAHVSGREFEQLVAKWVEGSRFAQVFADSGWTVTKVERNVQRKGFSSNRGYEVDVSVEVEGKFGRFLKRKSKRYIWIECKTRRAGTVKRGDIIKMDGAANDVLDATKKGQGYIGWLFVSNASFDGDAVSYATGVHIGCVRYDGKGFRALNDVTLQKGW